MELTNNVRLFIAFHIALEKPTATTGITLRSPVGWTEDALNTIRQWFPGMNIQWTPSGDILIAIK